MRRILCAALAITLAPALAGAQGLKVRATNDSSTWIAGSGQWRLRGESWTGFGANGTPGATVNDDFGLSRLMVRGEARLHGRLGLVAELKSSLVSNRTLAGGQRTMDQDVFDVQQLYGEYSASRRFFNATLRAGRFDLALGKERLVSPLDWTNSRRTFQGIGAGLSRGPTELRLFAVQPVQVRRMQPNVPDSMRQLYGAQLSRTTPRGRIELYWLRNENRIASFNGTAGFERRHTLGWHFNHPASARRVDADVEAAYQAGSVAASPVHAWMFASQFGWTLGGQQAPRLYVGLDAASGDKATGGTVQTFNQLFPLSHAYLGYIDVHGRQNIVDLSAGASMHLLRGVAQLDLHDFTRASTADGLYGADGSLARPAGTGLPAHVGSEIDLTLKRSLLAGRLAAQAGASHYFPGAFLRASGPTRDITWVYAQSTVSF